MTTQLIMPCKFKVNYCKQLTTLCFILITTLTYSQSWIKQNPIPQTNDLNAVTFIDDKIGYAVGSNGAIIKTIDSGNNWVSLKSGTTNRLYDIAFTNPTTGFVVGDVGTVLKTTDSGATWIQALKGSLPGINSLFFIDSNIGYIVGDQGVIVKTINGGKNWTLQTSNTTINLLSVYFTDSNNGWAVGYTIPWDYVTTLKIKRVIVHTINGGATWVANEFFPSASEGFVSVWFTNKKIGFITKDSYLLKTIDEGVNWSVKLQSDSWFTSVCFTDFQNGIASDSKGNIFRTNNEGETWVKESSGTTNDIYDICFTPNGSSFAVGEGGLILKYINNATSLNTIISPLIKIFPNPAKNQVCINISNYEIETQGVEIILFNTYGAQVKFLKTQDNNNVLDVSDLPRGLYILEIKSSNTLQTTKLIIE